MFLTLIVNGSTTQMVLHLLGMDRLSAAKVCISFHISQISHYITVVFLLDSLHCSGHVYQLKPIDCMSSSFQSENTPTNELFRMEINFFREEREGEIFN